MKYESNILERLIKTYGVVGNPKYVSEIIKQFIIQGKECYPNLFTYQSDWLSHIDEFGLANDYVVTYTGQHFYAPNTKGSPVKRAILSGSTKYRDIDTGEFLETFEEGRNLELVSVKMPVMPVLTTSNEDGTKTNILSVSEDIELRGIGDVRDELDCLTGEVTERIGEIVLDGSEDWRLNNLNTGTNTIIPYLDNYFTKQTKMIMAEFPRYSGSSIWQGKIVDYECYLDNAETIAIRINKDKLVTADINGFKQWLSQNPVTIQYQLATESIKTVELNIKDQNNQVVNHLTSFEGGTHFDTSSQTGSVLPTLEVDVVVDLEETIMVCSTEGNTM